MRGERVTRFRLDARTEAAIRNGVGGVRPPETSGAGIVVDGVARGNRSLCHKLVLRVAPNRIIAEFAFFSLAILYVHTYVDAMFGGAICIYSELLLIAALAHPMQVSFSESHSWSTLLE
jgi:hypothetical protein